VPFYLGLDASTQSLTAVLLEAGDARDAVIATDTFRYDDECPEYGTTHGVVYGAGEGVVQSPPAMWAAALDRMLGRVARAHPAEVARLAAIAVSAQQHGSVYLGAAFGHRLAALDPSVALAPQLDGVFTRPMSPVWMDSSTTAACREIASAVGSDEALAARTGSRAFERFAGPQIRAWAASAPEAFAATSRIHLVSSFLTSLLAGADAPIDPGDASGMNLMDLSARQWWAPALEATAPDLARRLPSIAAPDAIAGSIAAYWQRRYGLPSSTRVVVGTGDNPSSLVGTGLVDQGQMAVSLGTSDTVFGPMLVPRVSATGEGHVFGAPTGAFMGLTCFANGSLARERVRQRFGLTWPAFSDALRSTPPGNDGALMLPWFEPEITPRVPRAGIRLDRLRNDDAAAHVRAVVEGQILAIAVHSQWMGVNVKTIAATGGASANREILQVIADVFDAEVVQFDVPNSAALGAALRARHADRLASNRPIGWREATAIVADRSIGARIVPSPGAVTRYAEVRDRYRALEKGALDGQ
jgi:xylulokinase